jgi:N-methylhydantoinase B
MKLDPVTFAVIRNSFIAATREMASAFRRTTMLPVLYETQDYGISLLDDRLNVIADGPGIPIFVGSLDFCVQGSLAEVGGPETLRPGDVLLNNHPYLTAGQPADAAVIAPIFHKERLIGYAALRGHMGDLGAKSAYPSDSTDIFQEGTIFPAVKLMREGSLVDDVVGILRANSRLPGETVGSILAGAAALAFGQRRLVEVVEKYGSDAYYAAIDELLDHGERIARQAIERIPDGTYEIEDHLDDNGVEDEPVPIRCTVTVAGSDVRIDTSGSAGEQRGPVNCPWGYTVTTCRFALKRLASPELSANTGEQRPLTVVAPEGSIFNPRPPAPSYLSFASSLRLGDMIVDALAPSLPDTVPAGNGGDIMISLAYLRQPRTGKLSFFADLGAIGFGGLHGEDGMSALLHPIQASGQNLPAETLETRMPLLKRRYELMTDSGGPGRFRGGLAAAAEFEVLGEGELTVVAEKTRASKVRGLNGGLPPSGQNAVRVFVGSERELRLGKRSAIAVSPGDRFLVEPAGGGGWGDPFERDPRDVAMDVLNGYVSAQQAVNAYGVVLDPESLAPDLEQTAALRNRCRGRE